MNNTLKQTIIGFDMDGVIIDLGPKKIELARERGFALSPRDTQSDLLKQVLPETVRREIQKILYNEPEITLSAKIMPGVTEALETLTQLGIPFFLISRRKKYLPAIELLIEQELYPKYFDESNTFFVESAKEKNSTAAELDVTHFLDDELDVIEILDSVPNKILFDPVDAFPEWNATARIKHWDELLRNIL